VQGYRRTTMKKSIRLVAIAAMALVLAVTAGA
jgi:hypothetical protein